MTRSFSAVTLGVVLAITGCGSKDDASSAGGSSDSDSLNGASDVSSTESHVESMGSSIAGGSGGGTMQLSLATHGDLTGGDLATEGVGDAAKSFYTPSGCLVVTNDEKSSTVTYAFTGCTGPYGLEKITGTVTVGYSAPSASELKLTFTSTNLQLNNATVASWTGSADITANGNARTMDWAGMYTGTTARGTAFTHSSTKTITWTVGGTCIGASGTSDGQIGSLNVEVDVKSFQVCAGSCPAPGSEITIDNKTSGKTYDLTYGNETATYTGPNGGMVTYTPYCAQ